MKMRCRDGRVRRKHTPPGGRAVYGTNMKDDEVPMRTKREGHVSFCADALTLLPGHYELDVAASSQRVPG